MILFYIQITCCLLIINFSTSSYAASATEDSMDPSNCFSSYISPILKCFSCFPPNYALISDNEKSIEKEGRKKPAKKMLASANYTQRIPRAIIFHTSELLDLQDILSLSAVDKFFKYTVNENFWKQYGNKRNYKKWHTPISWKMTVFACTWYAQGEKELDQKPIRKAANLGHPQAREKVRALEDEIRRRYESARSNDYDPDYHRFSLTHKFPRIGYGYLPFFILKTCRISHLISDN